MFKVKKLLPTAKLPTKAHGSDLGYDLYSAVNITVYPVSESAWINTVKIRTGIAIELPPGWGAFIKDRSSIASKKKLHCIAGVIDPGYRGEIIVVMVNLSHETYEIKVGDKIAQLVPIPATNWEIVEVNELTETERGVKGFGSSDMPEIKIGLTN